MNQQLNVILDEIIAEKHLDPAEKRFVRSLFQLDCVQKKFQYKAEYQRLLDDIASMRTNRTGGEE